MSRTFIVPAKTAMAAAFEQAQGVKPLPAEQQPGDVTVTQFFENTKNDLPPADAAPSDLPPVVIVDQPAARKVDGFLDFIDMLSTTPQARRYMMWSTANSLNNYIIANAQAHIRSENSKLREVNQDVEYLSGLGLDQKTIDAFNEQKAMLDELRANADNLVEQGFEAPIPPLETCERLVNLRAVISEKMKATAKTVRDLAQPINDSIAYRLSQRPSVDEGLVMRWYIACDGKVSVEELRRVAMKQLLTDRKSLLDQAGQIIDLVTQLSWKSIPQDDEVEGVFDALPIHVQYKLIGNVVRTLNVAMANEVAAFIRFNRMDSITNRTVISAVLQAYIDKFERFGHDNAEALIAYEERGSRLPTLQELLADKSVQ